MQFLSLSVATWLRRVAWLLGSVAVVWGLSWLVVPALVKSQMEKLASEQLGRKVSVGSVDFKPWTLELTLADLAIATQDGASSQLELKRVYVNAEIESLMRLAPVVAALTVDGPRLRVTHLGGGKYDIDDILARFARPTTDKPTVPPQFALFNLSLTGGSVDFEDRSVNKTHTLRDLTLGVPFLSNLESRRAVVVEPKLAFSFNGSRFDSQAQSTPFADSRKTEANISLRDVDLAPYLPYLPPSLPARLRRGVIGAELKLGFEQVTEPKLRVSGEVRLAALKLDDAGGRDLLAFDALKVVLDDVRPLERIVKVSLVELTNPQLNVSRDAAGNLNLESLASPASAQATGVAVPSALPASSAAPATASPVGSWKAEVAKFVLREGTVHWLDAAVTPQANVAARGLSLEATAVQWPMLQPMIFQGAFAVSDNPAATVSTKAAGKAVPAEFKFSGTATQHQATVKAVLSGLPLGTAAPYLAQFLVPTLHGRLSSDLEFAWNAPDLQIGVGTLVLTDLALVPSSGAGGPGMPTIKQVHLSGAQIDLARRSVTIGKLAVEQPRVSVVRAQNRRWMFEDWLRAQAAVPPDKPGAGNGRAAPAGGAASAGWSVLVSDLALQDGEVSYHDDASGKPVAFVLSAIKLQVKDARPEGTKPVAVQLSARIKSERGEPGQFDYRGNAQWQPVALQGNVVATQIPVHAFEPYFGTDLNIELLRADAGFKGEVRYVDSTKGPLVRVNGDAVVEDFRANSVAANDGALQIAEELLNWKSLSLRGIELALAPGTATTLAVKETTLGDFFARVIVYPSGRINLQNLVKADPAAAMAPPAGAQAAASASAPGNTVAQAGAPLPPTGLEPVVNIGPVSLINGKVFFSDRFVKPNYSANLSELTGKLSAFSSVASQGPPQLADLELRGRAEGTASLEILGKVNPLAQPLALDIKGIVRDLELPPLSPYTVKYAGHGIERGKLSVDVRYLVLPNGQLTASNKVVLNQLVFGDKVEGAPASLPVKLAVALLADRNGVIDINLPISGSLNDPQFSLGPIIFKVIVNLVVKAITAPFSLLASAFGGGGDELSVVEFAPGSAVLLPQAREGLDKVARALSDRPSLKMTVVGTASLEAEREAYKRERLQVLLLSEKRRSLLASSAPVSQASAALAVEDADIPVLLKEVYKRADIVKPRNLVGVALEVPPADMEALLLANIPVTEDAMRELAVQRGVAVKDYLGAQKLPVERLFLGAVKPSSGDAKWSPRAELSLAGN